ncbi:MAG: phage virion morphogenesis protein [Paludibacter sp.]|nr:phage virion morphogenesis protein [Bacteroidales bacterium]MCM1069843.1 phage virion morphogenesis protein [Prevotella sp.]MCM1353964.1 phage virion morphogenesis protein [Bacteroides sp.]MCM1443394.1 phage virion morphogenesis protein [Muribaculum sp.]MCM1482097.1 phage virion morphogenesis protein [Paludibacter sp.]
MPTNKLLNDILNDIRVEITDEFDRNFERKAFFSHRWKDRRHAGKGSLMLQTGALRRSIRARVQGQSVVFTSSVPYAAIHNEGGEITVTAKMKRFFWAKYYECAGQVRYKKSGSISKASMRMNAEAERWYSLALMKVGSKIHIPQRQFIGDAPEVQKAVESIVNAHLENLSEQIKERLKNN